MRKSLVVSFALVALALSHTAFATTYQFTSDHCTGGCGTAPFGTVTLTQVDADADGAADDVAFLVDMNAGFSFVETGAGDEMYFKFNGTGVVLSDIINVSGTPALAGLISAEVTLIA